MIVAIYARVSTEKQEKEGTVNSQLKELQVYCTEKNFTIYKEYIDEGYSGELIDRPALDYLRDDAKKGFFESVLIHSPDRLSRKFIYLGLIQEELKKSSIKVIFLNRPDSKDTPEENLLNGVQGLIAEYEKAKIMERTRRGKLHKAKNNILVGGIAPYGYKYVPIDKANNIQGHYEIIENEGNIVKLIFSLLVNEKISIRGIARKLTLSGISPRHGERWRTSSLQKILQNETYTGITYYNKHFKTESNNKKGVYRRMQKTNNKLRPRDQWIPIELPDANKIINKNTFNKAQIQLKRNSELSPRNVKYQYLLKGLIKCDNCESFFHGIPCHGKLFYRCGNRNKTFPFPRECKVGTVSAQKIEDAVWSKFCETIKNPQLIIRQVSKLQDKSLNSKDKVQKEIDALNIKKKKTEVENEKIIDAYRENIISKEQFKKQITKINIMQDQLNKKKKLLEDSQELTPILTTKTIIDYCKLIDNQLEETKNNFTIKRYLLTLAVNKIILNGKNIKIIGVIPAENVDIATTSSVYYGSLLLLPPLPVLHAPVL